MAANSISPQGYKLKPQGKVKRRLQNLRTSYLCSFDFWASRTPLDLSHNEGARLAVDGLLSQGLEGYHMALKAEGEVDFLSEQEKNYFLENRKSHTDIDPDAGDGNDVEFERFSSGSHSATPCSSVSKDSDKTEVGLSSKEDENDSSESNENNVEAYFYTEKKAAGLKDTVREFIRKAKKSMVIVTDSFSDVELLCDLLEASKKRFVSVHLLLDHLNLDIFKDMWLELKLQGKNFPKFSLHSVEGQTFCAKTGRKLNGQISETFIITDWTEVLTGSFSFSWLSWLVHRNLAFLIKGIAVTHFLQEFKRLSSCSTPVPGFIDVPFTLPIKTRSQTNTNQPKGKTSSDQTDVVHIWDWIEDGLNSHKKERTQTNIQTKQMSRPLRQPVMQHVCMEKIIQSKERGFPVQDKRDVLHKPHTPRKSQYQNLVPYDCSSQNGVTVNQRTTGEKFELTKALTHSKSAMLIHRQDKIVVSTQNIGFNQDYHNVIQEDYWNPRQKRTLLKPPGIAAGINKLREERNTSKIKSNPTNISNTMHCFKSQEKGEKQSIQSPINAQGAACGLKTAVKSNGIKTIYQSPRHHFLQSQTTMRSPNTSISVQPKHESNFSPTTGNTAAPGTKASQQVKPPSRLAWMTQNNAARSRCVTRPFSFYSYDTIQKKEEQRQIQTTSGKSLARSKSMTERPATHHF